MKDRDDEKEAAADDPSDAQGHSSEDSSEDGSNADDSDETKKFERSDNLRRRSAWFQKRTGGG